MVIKWEGTKLYRKIFFWWFEIAYLDPIVIIGGDGWSKVTDWCVVAGKKKYPIYGSIEQAKELAEQKLCRKI